jgi:hypothetical protein
MMTALATAVAANRAGFPGSMLQEHIPNGWAQVESYLPRDAEMAQFYVGPDLSENTDWIELDVLGSPMTFSRDRVIVTYPL